MRIRYGVIILLLLCLGFSATLAQDAAPLSYGQVGSGTLDADTPSATFTFEGQQGETIYAAAFDTQMAVFLRLIGPSGVPLEQSDNNVLGGWLLGPVTLPSAGTYTLVIARPDWENQEGDFDLRLDTAVVTPLEETATLEGELGAGEALFFTYQATAGTVISYALQGEYIGLALASPSGQDYISSGYYDNPRYAFNNISESGVYFGAVQTHAPAGTPFTLQIGPLQAEPLTVGQTVTGSIDNGGWRIFSFDSAAAKLWHLDATFDQLDSSGYLSIFKPDSEEYPGGPLISDCCAGPNTTPRIDPFTAPEDGTYYVLLEWYSWSDDAPPAEFELSLASSSLVSLAPGTAITGKVSQQIGRAIYVYNGTEGEVIQVTLRQIGGNGAPGMDVYAPQDTVLYFDGPYARSATFEMELTQTGLYRFEVRQVGDTEGEMEFSLVLDTIQ